MEMNTRPRTPRTKEDRPVTGPVTRPLTDCVRVSLAGAGLLLGCAELDPLRLDGQCGNRIVENLVNEDCDSASPFEGAQCGEPRSPGACRFICAPLAPKAQCPPAYRCGVQGICEVSAGTFADAISIEEILANPELTELSDIDGDGRTDLVVLDENGIQIRFGETAGLGEVVRRSVGSVTGRPTLAELDGQPGRDLAVPLAEGVLVATGGPSRTILPVPYALASIPPSAAPSRLMAIRTDDALRRARFVRLELQNKTARLVGAGTGLTPGRSIRVGAGELVRFVPTANIDRDPHDELVIVTKASRRVTVAQATCTERADSVRCNLEIETRIPLPRGLTPRGGTQLADFDGDGWTDLLLSLGTASGDRVLAWVRGVDGGGFTGGRPPVVEDLARTSTGTYGPFPLAVAELSNDRLADLVLENRIIIRRSRTETPVVAAVPSRGTWTEAVVGDFNGDGHADVAAADHPSGIDLFLGDGRGGLSPFPIGTTGQARGLQVGDFDGDRIEDLAFVDADVLAVIYGEPSGGPSREIRVPELSQIGELVAGFALDSADVTADLLVRTGPPQNGRLVRMTGSGERALHPVLEVPGVPRWVVGGAFLGRSPEDLIVLTEEPGRVATTRQPYLLAGRGGAAFEPARELNANGCGFDKLSDLACVLFVVADLDADGRDELAVIDHARPCGDADHPLNPPRGPTVIDLLDDNRLSCRSLKWPGSLRVPVRLEAGDVDGDKRTDLVVGFTGFADGTGAGCAAYWGSASADTDFETEPLIKEGALQSLTLGAFDNDPAEEIVIVADDAVRLGDLAERKIPGSIGQEAERFASARILSARAGDISGDGLTDLVFTRPDGIVVTLQAACTIENEERGRCVRPRAP